MEKNIYIDLYIFIPYYSGILTSLDKIYDDRFNNVFQNILDASSISVRDVTSQKNPDNVISDQHHFVSNRIIKFSYEEKYVVPPFEDDEQNPGLTQSLYEYQQNSRIINTVYSYVCKLITCANIYMPSLIGMKKCVIYINNEYNRSLDFYDYQNSLQEHHSDLSMDLFEGNDKPFFKKILKWHDTIEVADGITTCSLGRAIGAFNTLLFSNLDNSIANIWTLIAIEALYCRQIHGNEKEQIVEKSKVILSSINDSKLKDAYKFRSKLLHGEANFQLYPKLLWSPKIPVSGRTLINHFDSLVSLLIKTFRLMARSNINELKFKKDYTFINE